MLKLNLLKSETLCNCFCFLSAQTPVNCWTLLPMPIIRSQVSKIYFKFMFTRPMPRSLINDEKCCVGAVRAFSKFLGVFSRYGVPNFNGNFMDDSQENSPKRKRN